LKVEENLKTADKIVGLRLRCFGLHLGEIGR